MCGRYVVAYDPNTLVSGFSVTRITPFPKRWNVAPQSPVPVVYETKEGERVAELMRWGLVPHWAKDTHIGHKLNNARAETVFEKPSFRQAVRRRRCLLPASGFYEWQVMPGAPGSTPSRPVKQPWYISAANGQPLAMAGLFEAWRPMVAATADASAAHEVAPADAAAVVGTAPDVTTGWLLTCCVITVPANRLMEPIHDRMPVFLAPDQWAKWLARDLQDAQTLAPLLQPCASERLQAWPVSRAVSPGSAEGEGLIKPLFD